MYTAFYGLREKPFALSPDPRFLYLAASHREALAHLLYGIEQGEGFISVTGEVGTGKTTLCRTLLERLEGEVEVAFLFNPSRTALELLQTINAELGLSPDGLARRALMAQLNGFLLEKKREGRRVLLIIDEAQTLSENTLEQVRLLSNLETSKDKLIQILLLGQPELDRKLDEQGLRQLRQRISVRWQLSPLTAEETHAYVRHRIAVAAGEPKDLFSEPALREVHRRTGGVPRLVNRLCDRALLGGYAERSAMIEPRLVRSAAREIPDTAGGRGGGSGRSRPWALWAGLATLVAAGLFAGLELGRRTLPSDLPSDEGAGFGFGGQPAVAAAPPSPAPAVTRTPALGELVGPVVTREGREFGKTDGTVPINMPSAAPNRLPALAPGILGRMLLSRETGEVIGESERALLKSFGREAAPDEVPVGTYDALPQRLLAYGLETTEFSGGSFALIARLEHPFMLSLHPDGADRDETLAREDRWVTVLGFDTDRARVAGVYRDAEVTVKKSELARHWTRDGIVIWERHESLPENIALKAKGRSVRWLQGGLRELGFYAANPTGTFDARTTKAVELFQKDRGLHADGIAGPLTQIALFGQLSRYDVPRLSSGMARADGEASSGQSSQRADSVVEEGGERG